jgi:hypothetical protein
MAQQVVRGDIATRQPHPVTYPYFPFPLAAAFAAISSA